MAVRRQDPRANQKARTRAAIVDAAKELHGQSGDTPTVADAAAQAGVSRATAYRYFPTQEALEVEIVGVSRDVEATEAAVERIRGHDVEKRLLALVDGLNPVAFENEEDFRRALWVYQDTWLRSWRSGAEAPVVREGRRMRWLDRVLEPLDLPDERKNRLQAALALTLGGEALVVMKDVCHLDQEEALDVLRWAAQAILRAGLADDPGSSAPGVAG